MADFQTAVVHILRHEGGYTKHKADSGNYNRRGQLVGTNRGISAPLMDELLRMPASADDMLGITEEVARAIYLVRFWVPIRGNEIKHQEIANILFDGCVNHGLGLGIRMIQQCVGVSADTVLGPATLAAINRMEPTKLIAAYIIKRRDIYVRHSASEDFLRGWMARLEDFTIKNRLA